MITVPVFCCSVSRDKALPILKVKFPDVAMKTNTGFAGGKGIEIEEAENEKLREIIDFIEFDLALILDHFACIN